MSKQLFKYHVKIEVLTKLLDKICEPCQKEYIIDINSYKRMKFYQYHTEFLNTIVAYYHYSKKFYAERDCTYNSFMTIVRHICRINSIEITSSIKYDDSSYNIEYRITKITEGSQINEKNPTENIYTLQELDQYKSSSI